MKTRLINELARIASRKYQYEYILHGTKEEYAVPEELIDTVRGTISAIMANPTIRNAFTEQQRAALKRFDGIAAVAYAELPWDQNTTASMILERTEWQTLCSAAAACLLEFCWNIEEWEADMK